MMCRSQLELEQFVVPPLDKEALAPFYYDSLNFILVIHTKFKPSYTNNNSAKSV